MKNPEDVIEPRSEYGNLPPEPRFPAGGRRDPVYNFLRQHGFVMSDWTDKHWYRADGLKLHVYGSGSKAVIYDKMGAKLADDALDAAVAKLSAKDNQ